MIKEFHQDNIFQTDRLSVRRLSLEDINAFHEMQGDINVMQYVAKKANTRAEDEKDLRHVISCYESKNNQFWVWAIDLKATGSMVGTIAIIKDKEDNWEIGYRLLAKQWRHGYASESVQGLIELCESIAEIHNIIAYADLRNVGSQRVLSKTGFVNLGIKYNDEEDCEDYIYSISTT